MYNALLSDVLSGNSQKNRKIWNGKEEKEREILLPLILKSRGFVNHDCGLYTQLFSIQISEDIQNLHMSQSIFTRAELRFDYKIWTCLCT